MDYKKLSIALSALVMLFATTTAYAVWDANEVNKDANVIQIGTGSGISVTESVSISDWLSGGQLVPSGVVQQSGDVTTATGVFTVAYNGALGSDLFLDVNYDALGIDDGITTVTTLNTLINISVSWDYQQNGSFSGSFGDNLLTFVNTSNVLPNYYDSANTTTRPNIYVQVVVTLTEPTTSSQYNAIRNKNIRFDMNFKVSPTTI